MKKQLLLFVLVNSVLLLKPSLTIAKESFNKNKNIDLGISFMPAKLLRNNGSDYQNFILSYSTGILVRFANEKKTGLTIGFNFTDYKTKSTYSYNFLNTSSPSLIDTTIVMDKRWFSIRYFELPLSLNLNLFGNKTIFSLNPGVIPLYYYNTKRTSEIYFNDNHVEKDSYTFDEYQNRNQTRFDLAFQLGIGIERQFSNNFSIKVEPIIRGGIDFSDTWFIGANFSFLYRLQ